MSNDKKQKQDQQIDFQEEQLLTDISKALKEQVHEFESDSSNESNGGKDPKKKIPLWLKILGIICIVVIILGFIVYGVYNNFLNKINYDNESNQVEQGENVEEEYTSIDEYINSSEMGWTMESGTPRKEKDVINILLIGEDRRNNTGRGLSDVMMIATINKISKELKLTSLMRDMYVQIPGYNDNKLNAAYSMGGVNLLYQVVEKNFLVKMDGYVLIDFTGFASLIDKLGGVEITLTDAEASYLNRTNYISDPKDRNVKAGTQILNGNQALGYARIRKVKTSDNASNDFGRTLRQRIVLNAIFERYKSKSITEMLGLLNDILPLITTDLSKKQITSYITTVLTLGADKLDNYRLPIDGSYSNQRIRGMQVLVIDLDINRKGLHQFLFNDPNDQIEE